MERLLFGDNQFFGVNHTSDEKGRQNAIKFSKTEAIVEILDFCIEQGINTFCFSTRQQVIPICNHLRQNRAKYVNIQIYPTIPDVHKFYNALSELGVMGTLKNLIPSNFLGFLTKGGLALATKDVHKILELILDVEMQMFHGLNTKVVFIQNNLADMLMGLGIKEAFINYAQYLRKKYDAEPGFMTMNLPRMIEFLEYSKVENPIICSSINKIGFRMFGGIEKYEYILRFKKYRIVAMQVLAAGAIDPKEAFEYINQFPGIESVLFGSSNKSHISQTLKLIN
jgi:Tfp pilus assembly protein PilZ